LHWFLAYAIGRAPSKDLLRRTAAPGLMFAANIVVFFYALQHASVASVSMISALQPVVVLFLAGPLFGERVSRWDVSWTLVALVGVGVAVISSNSAKATTKTTAVGFVLSLATLFTFTGYFLLSKKASGHTTERVAVHPLSYMAGVLTTATLLVSPVCFIVVGPEALRVVSGRNMIWIALIVCVPSMGHLLMSWTHRYVPVSISSLAMLVQPMSAALIAWPINGQRVVPLQIVGALIVVGALGAVIVRRQRPVDRR
jgi:drug/metabolite transporter (DMT)-like permease